jgi:mono/diheme cytochrome c family protein
VTVRSFLATIGCVALVSAGIALNWPAPGRPGAIAHRVDFSRDIRPIFNQSCTSCHGGVRQRNGVSFIYREEALGKGKSGRPTIVPGHPEKSELIARVVSTDAEARMPYHASPLPPAQIALLRQWIKEGAQWEDHWAFVAPRPQPLPPVSDFAWPRQPLDRFVLARLEKEGLAPSPEANKAELLRRVSFDLTGLPPTSAELAAFLADTSPGAYEKQVDRLLASPHYGERWAAMWLDLARYADSKGYEKDTNRAMWPYRDWVIQAFNRNLPYDRFVITQLAGDLLPHATLDDRIATSFQRQTPANDEAGTDDEEFRLVAAMDRVATTWTVLNGLTINCVQCHSHPYDPIRHVEYYKFLAFYDTSRDADLEDDAPTLAVPKEALRRPEAERLQQQQTQLLEDIVTEGRDAAMQAEWTPLPIAQGEIDQALGQERTLEEVRAQRAKGINPQPDLISSKNLPKFYAEQIAELTRDLRLARRAKHPLPLKVDHGQAEAVGTVPRGSVYEVQAAPVTRTVTALRIEIPPGDPAKARSSLEDGFTVSRVEAWEVSPDHGQEKISFHYFVPDSEEDLRNAIQFEQTTGRKAASLAGDGGFGFDATKLFQARWVIAIPTQPLTLDSKSRLKIQLADAGEHVMRRIRLTTSADPRWTAFANTGELKVKLAELAGATQRLARIESVALPVMEEQPTYARRQTLEFDRGNFLTKVGAPLSPDVPALLPTLAKDAPPNRLAMAEWFFKPGQPLTARVAVNRYWEQLFGTGIVETLEDFGSAGQPPSHPELLDWLALNFQNDLHWDMKALLRELVTSSTYRQSAIAAPSLQEKDPHNRLLAHGPQQRLTAEMVRDQALLASGLLNPALGGPPVMPPQPAGIWMTVYSDSNWVDATGPDRYRRAIYTFIKRSAVYPSFVTFDAAPHDVSLARRIPTSTPLQALVALNDPVYREAAAALARRMLTLTPRADARDEILVTRLDFGAQSVLSRNLSNEERTTLQALYGKLRAESSHIKPKPSRSDVDLELNVWTSIASVLFNLDPALTR